MSHTLRVVTDLAEADQLRQLAAFEGLRLIASYAELVHALGEPNYANSSDANSSVDPLTGNHDIEWVLEDQGVVINVYNLDVIMGAQGSTVPQLKASEITDWCVNGAVLPGASSPFAVASSHPACEALKQVLPHATFI